MIKFEHTKVMNIDGAIRGMRNPLESWDKSDSALCPRHNEDCHVSPGADCPKNGYFDEDYYCVGKNDIDLMKRLAKAGSDHRKYLRQIFVCVDITAPLYWWKEFDTYKVGTVSNSCSTMHKIHAKEFTLYDFSTEHLTDAGRQVLMFIIENLEALRNLYNIVKDKEYWYSIIQLLPESYNQKRTITLSYEVLYNIYHSDRFNHKLDEWRVGFMEWIESLPYARELLTDRS
jgi:hypothetical protein